MPELDKVLLTLNDAELDKVVDPERSYRIQLGRLGLEQLQLVAKAQRDADWERVKALVEALQVVLMMCSGEENDLILTIKQVAKNALTQLGMEKKG